MDIISWHKCLDDKEREEKEVSERMEIKVNTASLEKAVDLMNKYVELLKEARMLSSEIASITNELDLNFKTSDSQED